MDDKKGIRRVSEILDDYFGRHGLKRRVKQASVIHEWADLVGPHLAGVTEPRSVDAAGTLWVQVHSPAWLQELQLLSPTILKQLGRRGRPVRRIRWVLGEAGTTPASTFTDAADEASQQKL